MSFPSFGILSINGRQCLSHLIVTDPEALKLPSWTKVNSFLSVVPFLKRLKAWLSTADCLDGKAAAAQTEISCWIHIPILLCFQFLEFKKIFLQLFNKWDTDFPRLLFKICWPNMTQELGDSLWIISLWLAFKSRGWPVLSEPETEKWKAKLLWLMKTLLGLLLEPTTEKKHFLE